MALLKIARMGNPVLRERAQEVVDPKAPAVAALVRDMVETMIDAGGVGLAAPQVHVPLRVVVFRVPPEPEEVDAEGEVAGDADEVPEDRLGPLTVLINPVIEPLGEDMAFGWEGCLSVPGMRGIVPRHVRIRYSGLGLDGEAVSVEAEGFHARVVQHECDHLDGLLYPMRMNDLRLLGFNEEFDRHPLRLVAEEDDEAAGGEGEAPGDAAQ